MAATFSDLSGLTAAAANALDQSGQSGTVHHLAWICALAEMIPKARHSSADDLMLILRMCIRLVPEWGADSNNHASLDDDDIADLIYCYFCTFKIAYVR